MSVGYIAVEKELASTHQPLMLVELEMPDGVNVYRLTTHMLSSVADGGGGVQYGGHDYLPRLIEEDLSETQALSEQGIDVTPSVTITVADPDGLFYGIERASGFKGATLICRFVVWEVGTANFSPDSVVKFRGLCAQPEAPDDETIRITAVSKFNMTQAQLPSIRVQPTCPWSFPITLDQMQDAADNDDAPCYECGYSPAATGGNKAGNFWISTTLSSPVDGSSTTMVIPSMYTVGQKPCFAIVDKAGSREVVLLQGNSSGVLTVARGVQGTIATSHSVGATFDVFFPSCDRTIQSCAGRMGDGYSLTQDTSARPTGRFGGVQYMPPGYVVSRGYIDGKWQQIMNTSNQAKYGDLVPINYGTTWVDALVLNSNNDANYSNYEVLIGYGQHDWVHKVVVNGVEIPHTYNDPVMPQVPNQLNAKHDIAGGFWITVNDGRRNGGLGQTKTGGDVYGSLCVLSVTVPKQLASGSSAPQVQVWVDGPKIRVYSDANTYTRMFTGNPAWVILDVMAWAGLRSTGSKDVDVLSFVNTAPKFAAAMSYTSQSGAVLTTTQNLRDYGSSVYSKWNVSLSLRQRTNVADVIRGLRNSCRSLLLPNSTDGKIAIRVKEPLASQQASLPTLNGQTATNYTTPVSSTEADGTPGYGYVAYAFDESNIAKIDGRSSFKILPRSIEDSPNAVSVQFQNLENRYSQDSLEIVDTEDMARTNRVVSGAFQVYGINSFDRARRAVATWLAEQLRGNPRDAADGETLGDTGGTIRAEWQCSFRGVHLSVGDIVSVTYRLKGIIGWLFRVSSIKPGLNARTLRVQASYHNDGWYLDTYGQQNAPLYRHPQGVNARFPYGWCPGLEAPPAGDSLHAPTDLSFSLKQNCSLAADGSPIITMSVSGRSPVNVASGSPQPPMVALQATSSSTGGTIPGGRTYYVGVSAKNVAGTGYKPSFLSYTIACVTVPGTTNSNTITVAIPFWDSLAAGYVVFAGTDQRRMSYQGDGDSTPATITLTAYKESSWGAPDEKASFVRVYPYLERHAGDFGAAVVSCTSTSITVAALPGAGMTTNVFAGYDLTLFSMVDNQATIPIFNARVESNGPDTFVLSGGVDGTIPNPTLVPRWDGSTGLKNGDVIVVRARPVVGSDATGNYVEDDNLVNTFSPDVAVRMISSITNANPGVVTTETEHGYLTGDSIYVDSVTGTSELPRAFTITRIDATRFSIVDTSAWGTMTGGRTRKLAKGLDVDAEKGSSLWIFAGAAAGTICSIKSNTATRLYIDGEWPAGTPDSTSRFVIVGSALTPIDGPSWNNDDPAQIVEVQIPVSNYFTKQLLFKVSVVDADGNESLHSTCPARDCFVQGALAERYVNGDATQLPTDGWVMVDTSGGDVTYQCLPAAAVPKQRLTVQKITSDANIATVKAAPGDEFDDGTTQIILATIDAKTEIRYR